MRNCLFLPAILFATVLSIAACGDDKGSDPGVASGGGTPTPSASAGGNAAIGGQDAQLKFAQCMRENGVPDFEDPKFAEDGSIDDLSLPKGVTPEMAADAQEKCEKYLPNGGEPEKPNPEDLTKIQAYAKCMRENGMPDFPDPDPDGRFKFENGAPNPEAPELKAANEKCDKLMPGGGGGGVFVGGGE